MAMTPALSAELARLARDFEYERAIRRAALAKGGGSQGIADNKVDSTAGRTLAILDNADRDPALIAALRIYTETLEADAAIGRKVRGANPSGPTPKLTSTPMQLWAAMRGEMDRHEREFHRRRSPTSAASIVAKKHDVSAKHVLRVTRAIRDDLKGTVA